MASSTNLLEIFSSIQGEGLFVGTKQIFLRFAGCNLDCSYCDTKFQAQEFCKISGGKKDQFQVSNPVDLFELAEIVNGFPMEEFHSISLTGGEPLLHYDFLAKLIPIIKKPANGILLETNGTLPTELEKIIELVNIISMDIKISSMTKTATPWEKHKQFLQIAKAKKLYVKVVVGAETDYNELRKVSALISSIDAEIPLIIQPVTDKNDPYWYQDNSFKILDFQSQGLKYLKDVRVIPQIHKFLGFL